MNPEQIMQIAIKKGRFEVSLRWRDIPLQKLCNSLVKEGKLHKIGRERRKILYVLPGTKYQKLPCGMYKLEPMA